MCEERIEGGRRGYRPKGAPKGEEREGSYGLSGREVPRRGDTKPEEESSRSLPLFAARAGPGEAEAPGNLSVAQRRGRETGETGGRGRDEREEDERDPARRRGVCSFNPKQ